MPSLGVQRAQQLKQRVGGWGGFHTTEFRLGFRIVTPAARGETVSFFIERSSCLLTDTGVPSEDIPVENVKGEVPEATRDLAVEVLPVERTAGEKRGTVISLIKQAAQLTQMARFLKLREEIQVTCLQHVLDKEI